jgi:serine/threonine protein kinase
MADYFTGLSSGHKYEVLQILGEGGQGTVALVENRGNGKLYAAKWYKPSRVTNEQRQRLEVLVAQGCPLAPDKGIKYIWPIEMIIHLA